MKRVVSDSQLEQLRESVKPDVSQDVSITKWQFLHVSHRAMTLYWQKPAGEVCKVVYDWRGKTAEEINQSFNNLEWIGQPVHLYG